MVVAWQRMTSPLKNKSKAGVERLRKAKRDNAKKEVKKIKTLAKELAYVISIDSCTRQLLSQIHYMHDYSVSVFAFLSYEPIFIGISPKDGAYYCYCAYVLRISRYSDFLSPMLTNTGIFLRGLKLSGESRS